MKLLCVGCIYDRLVGKTVAALGLTLRTSKDAVAVLDGRSLCHDHLGQWMLMKQQQANAAQQAGLERLAAQRAAALAAETAPLVPVPPLAPGSSPSDEAPASSAVKKEAT